MLAAVLFGSKKTNLLMQTQTISKEEFAEIMKVDREIAFPQQGGQMIHQTFQAPANGHHEKHRIIKTPIVGRE